MERRDPAVHDFFANTGGRGEMIKAPTNLQDLRRRIYAKAKAEPSWRFWGLYVHVCKTETLQAAYKLARENKGAPGVDGVTFESVESAGRAEFLGQLREEEAAIRTEFPELFGRGRRENSASAASVRPAGKRRRRRRSMSAGARKAVSERMRKFWAERRKAKAGK